jgi:Caspase domain
MGEIFSTCYFRKPLKNWSAGIIFFSLFLLVSFNGYCNTGFVKCKLTRQYQDEPKARLFLITVIDSDDGIIGKRCEKDLEEITGSFENFSLWLDMVTIVPKVIKGKQYSKAAVNESIDIWLKSMEPTRADIVVFYFSGHGFRLANDTSVFPRMWLKTATDQNTATTNLSMEEDIYNRIVKMGAGVNIVLSDCCNSVPGANTAFGEKMTKNKRLAPKPEEMESDLKDFDNLFMPDNPVSIIATASDSTELAGGTPADGGFFTHFFLEALDKSIYDNDLEPTWETILNFTKEEARKKALASECPENKHNENGRCIQIAKFKMEAAVTHD